MLGIGRPSAVGELWCSDKYRIVAKLGQGGMAEVYLALALGPIAEVQKLVVLKRLRVGLREDPEFMKMFLREAKIAARFSHPNVVQTYALEVHDDDPVIVMEYIDGITLDRLVAHTRELPFLERLPLVGAVAQMLSGLGYVHGLRGFDDAPLNLVHRDVKPANVFVTFDGHVKLVDFGVAAPSDATVGGLLKGTPAYMAPELVDLPPRITSAADIFSTGAILWEILYGRPLWEGKAQMQVLYGLSRRELPPFEALGEDVPAELIEICRRALAGEPEDRQATAEELRADLQSMLQAHGSPETQSALSSLLFVGFSDVRRARVELVQRGFEHGDDVAIEPSDETVEPTVVRSHHPADVEPTIVRPRRTDDDFVATVEATIARLDAEQRLQGHDDEFDEEDEEELTRLMPGPSPRLTRPYPQVPPSRAAMRTPRRPRQRTLVAPVVGQTVRAIEPLPADWTPELPLPEPQRLRWLALIAFALLTLAASAAALLWMLDREGTVTASVPANLDL